jgi:hypothetical protein
MKLPLYDRLAGFVYFYRRQAWNRLYVIPRNRFWSWVLRCDNKSPLKPLLLAVYLFRARR